jgi:hypothetical protein
MNSVIVISIIVVIIIVALIAHVFWPNLNSNPDMFFDNWNSVVLQSVIYTKDLLPDGTVSSGSITSVPPIRDPSLADDMIAPPQPGPRYISLNKRPHFKGKDFYLQGQKYPFPVTYTAKEASIPGPHSFMFKITSGNGIEMTYYDRGVKKVSTYISTTKDPYTIPSV